MEKENCRIWIENIIVGIEPVKSLLKRNQFEEIKPGCIKNTDVYIIISYLQLI